MSFIVKTPPSIWEHAAPRVQVTSQKREGSAAPRYSAELLKPFWVLSVTHDFPTPDWNFSPFVSVYLMGEESKLLCIEMSGWTLAGPG